MMTANPYAALTSYQVSAVMMTGVKTGIFRCLEAGGGAPAEIAGRTGLSERGTGALLRALAALGYVEANAEMPARYQLTETGKLLNRTGAEGLAHLAVKEAYFYDLWSHLDEVVRSGNALLSPFAQRVKGDRAFIETFLLALNDLAHKSADGFFAVASLDGVQRLVDFGGGAAGYATLIAKRYPGLEITLLELPEIAPLAQRVVAAEGMAERIKVVAGDLFAPGAWSEERYDAVLVSHLLHDFEAAAARTVLQRASEVVKPGGRLIVNDVFTGAGTLKGPEAMFDLMMLVENPGGAAHDLQEVTRWVGESGWTEPVYQPLYFGGVMQARRRAAGG